MTARSKTQAKRKAKKGEASGGDAEAPNKGIDALFNSYDKKKKNLASTSRAMLQRLEILNTGHLPAALVQQGVKSKHLAACRAICQFLGGQ